jgi:hypothetical protein
MKEVILIITLCLIVVILLFRKENFSPIPDTPMGLQWGATPENLYQLNDVDSQNNYFVSRLSSLLSTAEFRDYNLGRGQGFGMSEINEHLGLKNYNYKTDKIIYI